MQLFQNSVLKHYFTSGDKEAVSNAFEIYKKEIDLMEGRDL
jgi:hypothetical protein